MGTSGGEFFFLLWVEGGLREQLRTSPIQLSRKPVGPRSDHIPREQSPLNTVNRQTVLVAVQQR